MLIIYFSTAHVNALYCPQDDASLKIGRIPGLCLTNLGQAPKLWKKLEIEN